MSSNSSIVNKVLESKLQNNVSKDDAEEAVKTIIKWIGDNPEREGLKETPKRVVKSFLEHYAGYLEDPQEILQKTFKETEGYEDIVVLKNIEFESHCEHHMLPIIGKASIGYYPNKRIVGISKLARVLNTFAKRLQTQEIMTAQILKAIDENLKPLGTAIIVEGEHHCMMTRGVHKKHASMITKQFSGCFQLDQSLQRRFLDLIR